MVPCGPRSRTLTTIDIALSLLAVAFLIGVNAFYVAGEFALVAVRRPAVERLADEGDRRALRVQRALSRLSFHLSGAQLGITVSSLVLGFIAEPAIAELLDAALGDVVGRAVSITLALLLATGLQMVFGELVPKNIAIARPTGSARWIGPAMEAANLAIGPLIRFLNDAADRTVRLLGIEPREELASVRSLEELELMIQSSAEGGQLDPEEARLLERSIDFPRKVAGEVMTPRTNIAVIGREATVADLVAHSVETGKSRFPVVEGDADHVVGVAHIKDVFRIPPGRRSEIALLDVVRPAVVVPESQPLDLLLRTLRSSRSQLAVVVDEYGGTAGVVTLEDLIEEIVGDIEDEHDERPPVPEERTDLLPGTANRFEVEEVTGLELPEGRYETLAGFVLAQLGRIPRVGESVAVDGWTLRVEALEGYRIEMVRVTPPEEASS